jgi:hypothetical protein
MVLGIVLSILPRCFSLIQRIKVIVKTITLEDVESIILNGP